jgi:hypothetical protein
MRLCCAAKLFLFQIVESIFEKVKRKKLEKEAPEPSFASFLILRFPDTLEPDGKVSIASAFLFYFFKLIV